METEKITDEDLITIQKILDEQPIPQEGRQLYPQFPSDETIKALKDRLKELGVTAEESRLYKRMIGKTTFGSSNMKY